MVVLIVLGAGSRLPDGGLGMMGLCNITMININQQTLSHIHTTDCLRRRVSAAGWGSGYEGTL